MTVTVAVDGVEKSYRAVKALRNVSFDLGPGRLNALVGHNGAGKTTLIKLMLGLIHAERGVVRVLNEDPAAGQFSARRQLGYLPENVAFNTALTGRETLAFYARLKQIKPASAWPLLDRVGLMHAADRRVGTYSKGMRQRLGLAQDADRAALGVNEAEHQFDQRGLAGAVMADQRAQPPRSKVERDVAQRLDRAKTLFHAIDGDGDGHRRLRLADGFGGGAMRGRVSTTPPG